jgi:hypothetical protein
MRRILRKIADGDVKSNNDVGELGDLSTLSDPGVVPTILILFTRASPRPSFDFGFVVLRAAD